MYVAKFVTKNLGGVDIKRFVCDPNSPVVPFEDTFSVINLNAHIYDRLAINPILALSGRLLVLLHVDDMDIVSWGVHKDGTPNGHMKVRKATFSKFITPQDPEWWHIVHNSSYNSLKPYYVRYIMFDTQHYVVTDIDPAGRHTQTIHTPNGDFDYDRGPAYQRGNVEMWYYQDKLHRLNGPAVITYHSKGIFGLFRRCTKDYYVYGQKVNMPDYRRIVKASKGYNIFA